ncbi:hypothetical protein [Pseudonocardia sp. TRM90224]|uniref:hypothetical protein n=1 Tax=Pseudonocardia sp. TRM90224 TaxID=2812678 RepID=UPI001E2E681E|nr:hypothetical protein [Pseudonocardia sp. TRM90224]
MHIFAPYARHSGPLTGLTAVLTIWSFWAAPVLAAPTTLAFVLAAYLWSLDLDVCGARVQRRCRGCRTGCIGCRERIEA